jgi:ectoine hydroxylase-related dioxygenase (phytanoyl-CoA dioxygenase family)
MDVVTLCLAVVRSIRVNGSLQVVAGTHRTELQALKEDRTGANVLGSATHTDAEIDAAQVVHLELEPGDVSVHHPNIVHASDPNRSPERRCGLTLRYISPATQCLDANQPVLLVEGQPVHGVNMYRSWPPFRCGPPGAGIQTASLFG